MLFHIMNAGSLVRTARLRNGLTQRELARKAHIPQPMVSLIESGRQDPRYTTLVRLLRVCDLDLDLVPLGGVGVDRRQFVETLKLTPTERVRRAIGTADFVRRIRKRGARPRANPRRR
jgi:transcriptional regulator with XRE-family HTH domain